MQPRWHEPTQTLEGELLLIVKDLESQIIKNKYCKECGPSQCVCGPSKGDAGSFKPNRGDEELPKLPKSKKQKHTKEKKEKKGKKDKTSDFLIERGIIVKYESHDTGEKGIVPTFMDHSGGIPVEASSYGTNQIMPDWADTKPTKNTFISEKAQIPSVSQTGYDKDSSSLHMRLNDGGDRSLGNWNIAPIEERLAQLHKSSGNPGIVEEIAAQVEQLMSHLS
tara:strand:+ start:9216 stop:9881 length:666 start_codon:yes stop_codon:yes gene_type:complete